MVFQSRKTGKNHPLTLEDHNQVLGQKFKNLKQALQISPSSFVLRKPFLSIATRKKVKIDGARCLFFLTFLRLQGDHHFARAQKWCHFNIFPRAFKQKD